jgi:hypothetical protein
MWNTTSHSEKIKFRVTRQCPLVSWDVENTCCRSSNRKYMLLDYRLIRISEIDVILLNLVALHFYFYTLRQSIFVVVSILASYKIGETKMVIYVIRWGKNPLDLFIKTRPIGAVITLRHSIFVVVKIHIKWIK